MISTKNIICVLRVARLFGEPHLIQKPVKFWSVVLLISPNVVLILLRVLHGRALERLLLPSANFPASLTKAGIQSLTQVHLRWCRTFGSELLKNFWVCPDNLLTFVERWAVNHQLSQVVSHHQIIFF